MTRVRVRVRVRIRVGEVPMTRVRVRVRVRITVGEVRMTRVRVRVRVRITVGEVPTYDSPWQPSRARGCINVSGMGPMDTLHNRDKSDNPHPDLKLKASPISISIPSRSCRSSQSPSHSALCTSIHPPHSQG